MNVERRQPLKVSKSLSTAARRPDESTYHPTGLVHSLELDVFSTIPPWAEFGLLENAANIDIFQSSA
jgi:hypothetical protein